MEGHINYHNEHNDDRYRHLHVTGPTLADAVRKQTITCANFDPDICYEMTLLGQNIL